ARRLPPQTPSLSSFLLRSKVLSLYRTILRSARHIPLKEDRDFVYDWARSDFERYRNETDVDKIKMLLSQGQVQAKTLDRSVTL
ncbi:LYR motif-containing protein 2, partial [Phlyctochytrium arcticum]